MGKVKKPDLDYLLLQPTPNYVKVETISKKYHITPKRCIEMAREIDAIYHIRRTVLIDKVLFEQEYRKKLKKENEAIENSKSVEVPKNYMRYPEAADHFSMSMTSFKAMAKNAGAIRKIGNVALVNIDTIEKYLEEQCKL